MWRGINRIVCEIIKNNANKVLKDEFKDFGIEKIEFLKENEVHLSKEGEDCLKKNGFFIKDKKVYIFIRVCEFIILFKSKKALQSRELNSLTNIVQKKIGLEFYKLENEFFKRIYDSDPNFKVIHSNRRVVLANRKVYKELGVDVPDYLIGQNIYNFVYPPYKEQVEERLKQLEEGEENLNYVIEKIRHFDGTVMELEASAYALEFMGEKYVVVNYRKLDEKNLVERLSDITSMGFFLYELDSGKVLFASKKALETFGYSEDEVINRSITDFIHHEFREHAIEGLDRKKKDFNGVSSHYFKMISKSGVEKWMLLLTTTISYSVKRTGLVIFVDVTKEKEIEKEVERLTTLFNVFLWRMIVENGVLKPAFITDTVEKVTGYLKDEIMNKKNLLQDIIFEEDKEKHEKALLNALKGKETNIEYRIRTKTGDPKWLYDNIRPEVGHDGNVVSLSGISIDITNKKRIEEHLVKVEKISSIGKLAGGIAHDFNNLLTGIIGNLNLVNVYGVGLNPIIKKRLKEAEKAAVKAKELTAKLLTFAKGGEPVKEDVNITELIKTLINDELDVKDSEITVNSTEEDFIVRADETLLKHAFQNIVQNALEAVDYRGKIEIDIGFEVFKEDIMIGGAFLKRGKYIKISIKDNGAGIPQEYISKVFEPYFTTKIDKNGLGLSISYSIIKKHGGFIELKSELGKGTTVKVYLPLEENVFSKKEEKKVEKDSKTYRILVMDDEEIVRNVLEDLLTELGYEVVLTKSGEEALKEYVLSKNEGKPFDLVILDLTVPNGMGGEETIKELKRLDLFVKAIVTSGYYDSPVMANYSNYGFCGRLKKPFVIDELKKAIESALQ